MLLAIRGSTIADLGCGVSKLDRGWVDLPGIPNVDIGIATYHSTIRDLRCCFAGQQFARRRDTVCIGQPDAILFGIGDPHSDNYIVRRSWLVRESAAGGSQESGERHQDTDDARRRPRNLREKKPFAISAPFLQSYRESRSLQPRNVTDYHAAH